MQNTHLPENEATGAKCELAVKLMIVAECIKSLIDVAILAESTFKTIASAPAEVSEGAWELTQITATVATKGLKARINQVVQTLDDIGFPLAASAQDVTEDTDATENVGC
jgi:hypothetical protein